MRKALTSVFAARAVHADSWIYRGAVPRISSGLAAEGIPCRHRPSVRRCVDPTEVWLLGSFTATPEPRTIRRPVIRSPPRMRSAITSASRRNKRARTFYEARRRARDKWNRLDTVKILRESLHADESFGRVRSSGRWSVRCAHSGGVAYLARVADRQFGASRKAPRP
jgi:hypothetical protein